MDSLSLAERIDKYFPLPKSNWGYKSSEIIKTLILMQHEGSFQGKVTTNVRQSGVYQTVPEGFTGRPCVSMPLAIK